MEALEKKILKGIIKNLINSTSVLWLTGTTQQWSDHANKMRNSINDSVKLIEAMMNEEEQDEKNKGKLTL
jgi:hypothetical protein